MRSKVAEICFEVHAFQHARKAVLVYLALEDPEKFPSEATEPFIRRAERIITIPNLVARLDYVKSVMTEAA